MSVIDSTVLRTSAVAFLKAADTLAGLSVFSPSDWPNLPEQYPMITIRTPHERKQNASGRNGEPTFWTTVDLVVIGRVAAQTEYQAYAGVEQLSVQIEQALLTNQQFINDNGIEQFHSVETSRAVKSESELHIGECAVVFACEVFQQYDTIIDTIGDLIVPIEEITITVVRGEQTLASQDFKFNNGDLDPRTPLYPNTIL